MTTLDLCDDLQAKALALSRSASRLHTHTGESAETGMIYELCLSVCALILASSTWSSTLPAVTLAVSNIVKRSLLAPAPASTEHDQ